MAVNITLGDEFAKAGSTRMARNRDLCDNILIDILLKLPVKSLMRFKSVSKSWNSLVKDPRFITQHLASKTTNDERLILHTTNHRRYSILFVDPNTQTSTENSILDYLPAIENPCKLQHLSIIDSCNGLLCVSACPLNSKLFLSNPATRDSIALPELPQHTGVPDRILDTGFGFNPDTNDYEVMRCLCYKKTQENKRKQLYVDVEVYSKNLGAWRNYSALQECFVAEFVETVTTGGVIHWNGYKRGCTVIAGFDLKSRRFTDLKLPGARKSYLARVAIVGDSLGAFVPSSDSSGTDVWVMKEYGVHESWTKQFSISNRAIHAVRCTRKGEAIVKRSIVLNDEFDEYYETEISAYDPLVKQFKPLFALCIADYYEVEDYMESLIPVR